MKTLLTLALISAGAAQDVVCVRNFLAGGTNVCESFPDRFAYLEPANPAQTIETCTLRRPASLCSTSPDFTEVVTRDKETICVLQWDTGDVNYCSEDPVKYNYVYRNGAP